MGVERRRRAAPALDDPGRRARPAAGRRPVAARSAGRRRRPGAGGRHLAPARRRAAGRAAVRLPPPASRAAATRRCWSSARAAASCPTICAPGASRPSSTPRARAPAGGSAISRIWRASGAGRASLGGGVLMVNPLTAPTPVAADRAEPLLPVEPALPQPAVPAHRGAARLGRACPGDLRDAPDATPGTALNREPAHRSRRDLPPQAGGAGGALRALPRRAGLRLVLRRRGPGADRLRHLRGAGRAARQGLAALARRATAAPTAPTSPRFRAEASRAHPLPRLDAVADRRPAGARVARDRRRPRPADRPRRRGRRRLVLAGPDGARRVGRRAAPTSSTPTARTGA